MSETINDKLKEWENRLNIAQVGHYMTCERYRLWHNIIGLLLVCLSTFVSAFIFVPSPDTFTFNVLKTIGIIVAVLAAFQTFIRPSEMSELHRIKATRYGSLKRKVEAFRCCPDCEKDFSAFSVDLLANWSGISEDSPITSKRTMKKIEKFLNRRPNNKVEQGGKNMATP